VLDCAALALPHAEAGEALALYVVAADQADAVVAAVRRSLPAEWICESVTLLAELPRNAHGKLMRSQLPPPPRAALSGADTRAWAPGATRRADENSRT